MEYSARDLRKNGLGFNCKHSFNYLSEKKNDQKTNEYTWPEFIKHRNDITDKHTLLHCLLNGIFDVAELYFLWLDF